MIECPKCKSKQISIVSTIHNEPASKYPIHTIQVLCCIVLGITLLIFAVTAIDDIDAFKQFMGETIDEQYSGSSSGTINEIISGGISAPPKGGFSPYEELCIEAWIMRWTFITLIIATFAGSCLPPTTITHEKCICHECEHEWKYKKEEQTENPPIE